MKRQLNISRLLTYIAIFALVVIMFVGSTFSWSPRTVDTDTFNESYRNLNYSFKGGSINNFTLVDDEENQPANKKAIVTYEGINDNGRISYEETPISDDKIVKTESQKVKFFKTVINNTSNKGSAMVSLYVNGMNYKELMGEGIHVGIFTPEKTYDSSITVTESQDGNTYNVNRFCLEDNILVENNSSRSIYWYVVFDAKYIGEGELNIGNIEVIFN